MLQNAKMQGLQQASAQQDPWEQSAPVIAAQNAANSLSNAAGNLGNRLDNAFTGANNPPPYAGPVNNPPLPTVQPTTSSQSDENFNKIMQKGVDAERAANNGQSVGDSATQRRLDEISDQAEFDEPGSSSHVSNQDKAFMKERDPQRYQKLFGGM